jgi:hypothetical protein
MIIIVYIYELDSKNGLLYVDCTIVLDIGHGHTQTIELIVSPAL